MKLRSVLALALVLFCAPALAQINQGTSPLTIPKGGTGASTAGGARTNFGLGSMATQNANGVVITGGTVTGLPNPSVSSDAATKQYVDNTASGLTIHTPVALATAAALPANTYNNGASGVGATLTASANAALMVDGVAVTGSQRILVKNEAAPANNGIYTVTATGSAGAAYVLTRATDTNTAGTGSAVLIGSGTYVLVNGGSTNTNSSWIVNSTVTTMGTSAINWAQFTAAAGASIDAGGATAVSNGVAGQCLYDNAGKVAAQTCSFVPAAYGASGSTTSTTGTISGSASTLTLGAAIDFVNGQGIRVNGAGAAPTIGAATAFTATPAGTLGAISYTYYVEAVDGAGGVKTAASATFSNGAIQLINGTSTVNLAWTAGTGSPAGYAILVKCTGCVQYTSSPQLIAVVNTTSFTDTGTAVLASPDWLPTTNLAADQADWLVTTISSGAGTTTLTLGTTATTTVSAPGYNNALHDDTTAIQNAINAAQTAHGKVHLVGTAGNLFRTTSTLTISSHIELFGDGVQSVFNLCLTGPCRNVLLSDLTDSTAILPPFQINAITKTSPDAVEIDRFGIVYLQPAIPNSGIVGYSFQGTNGTFYCMGDYVHDMLFTQADALLAVSNCNGWIIEHNKFYNWNVVGIRTGKGTGSNDWWIKDNTLTEGPNAINNSNFIVVTSSAAPHIIGNKMNAGVGGLTGVIGVLLNPQFNGSSIEPFIMTSNSIEGNLTALEAFNSCSASANGAIKTFGAITGGTSGTFGTYNNIRFTGGSGTDGSGSVIINAAGAVSQVILVNPGFGYVVGDTLSATVGGVSGFSVPVATINKNCLISQISITGNQMWAAADIAFSDGLSQNFFNTATISGNSLLTVGAGSGVTNVAFNTGSVNNVLAANNVLGNTSALGSTSFFDGGSNINIKTENNHSVASDNQSTGTTTMSGLSCGGTVTNNNDNAVQAYLYGGSGITSISKNGVGVYTQASGTLTSGIHIILQPGETVNVACGSIPASTWTVSNP